MGVNWTVSQSDVEKHPKYKEGLSRSDLDRILKDFGMDIRQGYQTDGRHLIKPDMKEGVDGYGYSHVSVFTGEVSWGPRFIGLARQDGLWRRFVDRFLELPLV